MTMHRLTPDVRANPPRLPPHCSLSWLLPSVPLSQPHASTPPSHLARLLSPPGSPCPQANAPSSPSADCLHRLTLDPRESHSRGPSSELPALCRARHKLGALSTAAEFQKLWL